MRTTQKIRMAFQLYDVTLDGDLLGDVIGYDIDGDFNSAIEQEGYEANLVSEARLIVEGKSCKAPTKEHLRVLLEWLDGLHPDTDDKPF